MDELEDYFFQVELIDLNAAISDNEYEWLCPTGKPILQDPMIWLRQDYDKDDLIRLSPLIVNKKFKSTYSISDDNGVTIFDDKTMDDKQQYHEASSDRVHPYIKALSPETAKRMFSVPKQNSLLQNYGKSVSLSSIPTPKFADARKDSTESVLAGAAPSSQFMKKLMENEDGKKLKYSLSSDRLGAVSRLPVPTSRSFQPNLNK